MTTITATYSPDDNKIRVYASSRLDPETYARVRAAGYIWAPKQDLFVAPKWTPEREDLALELAGDIGDEDTALVDRAEERAERFEGYSESRAQDAHAARSAVAAIADNIPLGQPILVGHHSERHARKDAQRIENGMRKAIKMWETSTYWTRRAAGAVAAAKYKERPDVRARRIKTIEADRRREERALKDARAQLGFWAREPLTLERAKTITGDGRCASIYRAYPLAAYPRRPPASQYEGETSLWSALDGWIITAEQARDTARPVLEARAASAERWLAHLDNRLAYERAMLGESGWVPPAKPKTKAALPLLNYSGEIAVRNQYQNRIDRGVAVGITKAELAAIGNEYKGTRVSEDGTHRVRTAMHVRGNRGISFVYLTDSKQHSRPDAAVVAAAARAQEDAVQGELEARTLEADARARLRQTTAPARAAAREQAAPFEALRESLKTGVKVVTAPQLFPTPAPLAARMVEAADVQLGDRVLEPSAGTGAILRALAAARNAGAPPPSEVVAVEINRELAGALPKPDLCHGVYIGDFMEAIAKDLGGPFDRILMNPPFAKGADIAHIQHALSMLAPAGRLVAICADGSRQNAELKPMIEQRGGTWEQLPAGTFLSEGTGVMTVLLTVDAPAVAA